MWILARFDLVRAFPFTSLIGMDCNLISYCSSKRILGLCITLRNSCPKCSKFNWKIIICLQTNWVDHWNEFFIAQKIVKKNCKLNCILNVKRDEMGKKWIFAEAFDSKRHETKRFVGTTKKIRVFGRVFRWRLPKSQFSAQKLVGLSLDL